MNARVADALRCDRCCRKWPRASKVDMMEVATLVKSRHARQKWTCSSKVEILVKSGDGVVTPTVLPPVGRRGPRPGGFVGALRPSVDNTVGITTDNTVGMICNPLQIIL